MRPDPGEDAPLRGLVVLVVEDELLIAMTLFDMLEGYGARVLGPAATIRQALRLLETDSPDVALLDVHLRDGLVTPVAEALRSRDIPFAVSSAYRAEDYARIEALADAPRVGKLPREEDLISVLGNASKR